MIGVLRGGLSARHRWNALAWSLAAENARALRGRRDADAPRQPGRGRRTASAWSPGRRVAALWPSALRFRATPVHRPGTEPARVPRRGEPGAADRPGRAHRRSGGPGAGRRLTPCGHHPVRRAGAVPGAVHAGAGDGLPADHPGRPPGDERRRRVDAPDATLAADRHGGPGGAGRPRGGAARALPAAADLRQRGRAVAGPHRPGRRRVHRRGGQPGADGRRPGAGPVGRGGPRLAGGHRRVGRRASSC